MLEQDKNLPGGLDPRCSLLSVACFSICVACLTQLWAALVALLISFCVLALVWKKGLELGRRLLAANLFILFLWLITPFTIPGELIWQWSFFKISREGLQLAFLITLKANAIALVFLSLIAPTPLSSLGTALHQLHCPDKLTWIFLLMSRNIHILRLEWLRLTEAARLRCFRARSNLHSYKTLGSLLGLFLIRAAERSRILHEAMLLRGYNGRLPFCDELHFRLRDYLFFLGCFIVISLLLLLEFNILHVSL